MRILFHNKRERPAYPSEKPGWVARLIACLVLSLTAVGAYAQNPPDFTGSFDTFNQRVAPGESAVYNLTLIPLNGFVGYVSLTASGAPIGTTVTFNPQTVLLNGGNAATAISVQTSSFTPGGTYDISLTATSGSIVHNTAITINVGANGDFAGSFDHTTATVAPGGTATFTLTLNPLQGFNANVTLSVSGLPTGTVAGFSPATVVGGSGSSVLSVTIPSNTPSGLLPFTITAATPGLYHTTSINLLVGAPDFSGSITPTFQAIAPGGSAQYTLTLKTIGTQPFGALVTPSVVGLPGGVTASFNPATINPDATGGGSSVLTLTASPSATQGTFNPVVVAAANGQSHGEYITLAISAAGTTGDFTGSFSPLAATASIATPATYSLTLQPLNGFNGNVALGVSGLPDGAIGSFSPSLVPGASGSSTLSVAVNSNTPNGIYTFTVNATSGSSLTHTTTLTLLVGVVDFTGTTSPNSQTVAQGSSAQYTVSLSTLGTQPFGNNVTLYVSNLPAGVTASFNPATVSPDSNGTSVLTLTTTSGTPAGSYTPLLTATGGNTTHERNLGLNVTTAAGNFAYTGNLNIQRASHTATLLNSGKVLIVDGNTHATGAEMYDPSTGQFTYTGSNVGTQYGQTATLLNNGKVLIVGGVDASNNVVAAAQIFDPATGTFATTGSLNVPRYDHTATLLPNGMVLIIGGTNFSSWLASAELYDPVAGVFMLTGNMPTSRWEHSATLLNTGKVLIVGGVGSVNPGMSGQILTSALLYDPQTGAFTATGSLSAFRDQHTATLLNNGKVLIAGGMATGATALATAELYDPIAGTFSPTGAMNSGRVGHTTTVLNSGLVLVTGGELAEQGAGPYLATAELYDPNAATFSYTGNLNTGRVLHTSTLLNNGRVLIAGGIGTSNGTTLTSAELYTPTTLTLPNLVSIAVTPANITLSPGTTQQFIATGTFSDNSTQQLASVTWSSSDTTNAAISNDSSNPGTALVVGSPSVSTPVTITATDGTISGTATLTVRPAGFVSTGGVSVAIAQHTETLLPSGLVLITGGNNNTLTTNSASLYNVATGTFTATTSPLNTARYGHTATLLPNGLVLIAGGAGSSGVLSSAELFNPATGTFTATTGNLITGRLWHTATLLNNGTVLIAGGYSYNSGYYYVAAAEIYNPATNSFTSTGNLNTARYHQTATLLNDGTVLIAGGYNSTNGYLASAEIYNPTAGTFSFTTGNLNSSRYFHTATLLPGGSVLIAGGQNPGYLSSGEIYNPATKTFTLTTGSLSTPREYHTATLLNNGTVLLAGGQTTGGATTGTAEIYNPATNAFAAATSMNTARYGQTATLLVSGEVLLVGGYNGSYLSSAELY